MDERPAPAASSRETGTRSTTISAVAYAMNRNTTDHLCARRSSQSTVSVQRSSESNRRDNVGGDAPRVDRLGGTVDGRAVGGGVEKGGVPVIDRVGGADVQLQRACSCPPSLDPRRTALVGEAKWERRARASLSVVPRGSTDSTASKAATVTSTAIVAYSHALIPVLPNDLSAQQGAGDGQRVESARTRRAMGSAALRRGRGRATRSPRRSRM